METPKHVAIIMDGNRRWAKKEGLKSNQGHEAGIGALEKVVEAALEQKIEYLTVYALSTENLQNRSKLEIGSLFKLIQKGFIEKVPTLKSQGVSVEFFGNIEGLPLLVRKTLEQTKESLVTGKKLQLNIAINYGGRDEIVRAIKKLKSGQKIDETSLNQLLDSRGIPEPELIIRTGGEKRLSNFLLWQAAYSELIFIDTLWPDFNKQEFKNCLVEYEKRKKNFGA